MLRPSLLALMASCAALGCGAGQTAAPSPGLGLLDGAWVVVLSDVAQSDDPSEPNCSARQLRLALTDSGGRVSGSYVGIPFAYCEAPEGSGASDIVSLPDGPVSGTAMEGRNGADVPSLNLVLGAPVVGVLSGIGSDSAMAGTGTLTLLRMTGEPVAVQFRWRAFH